MTNYFCTYFDSNYLYKGITMYRSLSRVSQDFKLWILCFDELTYKLLSQMNLDNVELISLEEFEDEELKKTKQDRSLVEYFWTCTPSLPLYILSKYPELDMITYIDADLYFYSDPLPIFEEFSYRSILLIEHRYAKDIENKTKNNGIYNVQFITFRNDETGITALRWWRDRCLEWCYRRAEDGKMGDQKYLDDWTTRFSNVCVLKNKGAGLAPWNIIKYNIRRVENEIYVDEDKLIFYHFHYFKMYSNKLFNLSTYKLYKEHKKLIYIPHINSLGETIQYVRGFDKSFNKGYSSFKFDGVKDMLWTLMSFFRGNFLLSKALINGINEKLPRISMDDPTYISPYSKEDNFHPGKAGMIKISPYKIPVKRNRIIALIIHYIIKTCFSVSQVLTFKYFKEKEALEFNRIRKMLIIRTDQIGDVTKSTPAFKALRDIFTDAHIVLLAGSWSKEIVEVMPSFNEVIYFDAPWIVRENKDIKGLLGMVKYLRSEKFDLVIDLRGDFRNIILMYLLNIKHRLGFNITGCDFLLTHVIPCSDNHHPVNLCLSMIEHFIPKDKQKYNLSLEFTEADQKFVEVFLNQNNIAYGKNEDLIVVIHPGARWYGKRWKAECFSQIADSLIERYKAKVIIAGGPKDFELTQNIKNNMKYVPVITPQNLSLRHFLALLGKSSLFIGVDSGPMHMATAMNVRVVAILGPALSEAVGPYGKEHIVVTKQQNYPCSPCSQTRCKMPDNNCVEAVTVEEVWEAVEVQIEKILAQKGVGIKG